MNLLFYWAFACLETKTSSLFLLGHPPQDNRGKHDNRPHKMTEETKNTIRQHISSFKGRHSHYAMGNTRRRYLPEDLTVSKMHFMFMERYPGAKYVDVFCVTFFKKYKCSKFSGPVLFTYITSILFLCVHFVKMHICLLLFKHHEALFKYLLLKTF